MALLDPNVTITPLLVEYYLKTYNSRLDDEGVHIVEDVQNLWMPWHEELHAKKNNEFIFCKLDINNGTKKNIEIAKCVAIVLRPSDKRVEVFPVQERYLFGQYMGKCHMLSGELRLPIKMDNLFEIPTTLKAHENEYRYLCLKIIDFPDKIDNVGIKILMMEGQNASDRVYSTIVHFDKDGQEIFFKEGGKFWKNINYDENGIIRGLR